MAYAPPSGGNIVVELSSASAYVPPSASALNVDLAVEEGSSGDVSYITAYGALALAPAASVQATVSHSVSASGLTITGYVPTYATTKTSLVSAYGTLSLASAFPAYKARSTVGAGALSLQAHQPVYFMGYTQTVSAQGSLSMSAGGVAKQAQTHQIPAETLTVAPQAVSFSSVSTIGAGGLVLAGLPIAGEKRVVHAEVECIYFYPNITLAASGSLSLEAFSPTTSLRIRNEIDAPCGLMAQVAAGIVCPYTYRLSAGIEGGYSVWGRLIAEYVGQYSIKPTNRVVKEVEAPYKHPIATAYEAIYSVVTAIGVRGSIDSYYSVQQAIRVLSSVESPYALRTNVRTLASIESSYTYYSLVREAIASLFSLTSPVAGDVVSPYSFEAAAKARAEVVGLYSIPASRVITIDTPPYVEYAGRVLPIEEAEVSIAEGDYSWTCTAIITNVADYAQLRLDQRFALVIGSERYEFVVDGKELDRSAPANYGMRVTGISPSSLLASPRCVSASYAWDTVTTASGIAKELIPELSWYPIDWVLPAYRFSVQSSTPVEAVRTLAEAIGAVLESEIDGSLYVRSKYPVSVEGYADSPVSHTLLEETDILSVSESYVSSEKFNRLIITDIEQSISDSLEWIEDYAGATTGVVRAYLYPWRTAVSLLHTGVAGVSIAEPVTTLTSHEEIIEVFQGQGGTAYPIFSVSSIEYEAQDTGGIIFDPDSRTFTVGGPSFNSVIRLVYVSRSLDYRVALPEVRPTQFLLESAQL